MNTDEWKLSDRVFYVSKFSACGFSSPLLQGRPSLRTAAGIRVRRPTLTCLHSQLARVLLLPLLCGDIQLNPGPQQGVKSTLSVYCQNVQSLKNKLSICEQHLSELLEYDCIALTETWLNDHVNDNEIPLHTSFSIYRRDRPSRGGGVLLAINRNLKSRRRADLESPTCELLWTEVSIKNNKTYVGCYYRPPNSSKENLTACFESVIPVLSLGTVILVGDFNLSINWLSPSCGIARTDSDTWFIDNFIDGLHLLQHNLNPTRNLAILDYIISSHDQVNIKPRQNLFECDHDSLSAYFPLLHGKKHSIILCKDPSSCGEKQTGIS